MSADACSLLYEICKRRCLFNITLIDNIPSIIQYGILCYNEVVSIPHQSIALADVQDRRETISIPNGLRLHDYANLYFNPRNPMMYKRKDKADRICVLAIDATVLNMPNCVVSDGNAASPITRFFSPIEGLQHLDFSKIYTKYWNVQDDALATRSNRRLICAEVLIPHSIPYNMIVGAVVVDSEAQSYLRRMGFEKEIKIYPNYFFR